MSIVLHFLATVKKMTQAMFAPASIILTFDFFIQGLYYNFQQELDVINVVQQAFFWPFWENCKIEQLGIFSRENPMIWEKRGKK